MLARAFALASLATAMLAACEQGRDAPAGQAADDEMGWARGALERNPNLEVIAVDDDDGVFTVRDRRTGATHAVKADDLAAVPVAELAAARPERAIPGRPAEYGQAPEEPVSGGAPAAGDTGAVDASMPRAASEGEEEELPYTIERQGGQLRVSGPGISIVSADAPAAQGTQAAAGQRAVDPIICEGDRMMRFDNRQIFVNGNAITARDGCELHITNSRIVATGTGVVVRGAAVHITNSYVEGAEGAYDAGPDARLFLREATLKGTQRRDLAAQVQDLDNRQGP